MDSFVITEQSRGVEQSYCCSRRQSDDTVVRAAVKRGIWVPLSGNLDRVLRGVGCILLRYNNR
jgi:hypothetical protein